MSKRRIALIIVLALLAGLFLFVFIWRGGCTESVKPTTASYDVTIERGIATVTGENADPVKHKIDLYVPEGVADAPLIAIFHGGGWNLGDRTLPAVQDGARWFAERGVIAAAAGYRLTPQVKPTQQALDVARVAAWLYAHAAEYGGDPDKIFLLGHSAGAHLSALVACDRRYLKKLNVPESVPAGVITLAGIFDLRGSSEGNHPMAVKMVTQNFGPDADYRAQLSPIAHVHAGCPPFLMLRAKGDHIVPREQPEQMQQALQEAGVNAWVRHVGGRGHIELFHAMTEPGDVAGEAALEFIQSF